MFCNALVNVLELDGETDWVAVRRSITDDKIAKVYSLFGGLWPLETDLLALLPKPDGIPRAVYTGLIHPDRIVEIAIGASLYFGQIIVQHPFVPPKAVQPEYSPVDNPRAYRSEFLKAVVLFLRVYPLVERGLINLVVDPCHFDGHLQRQMLAMAEIRWQGMVPDARDEEDSLVLVREDLKRSLMALPVDAVRAVIRKASPDLDLRGVEHVLEALDLVKERDPLAVLQENARDGGKTGQLNLMRLAPNFEMALYLAQATGSAVVTDSGSRWEEMRRTLLRRKGWSGTALPALAANIGQAGFLFPRQPDKVVDLYPAAPFVAGRAVMRDAFKYLARGPESAPKPNVEQSLAARFARAHGPAQTLLKRQKADATFARVSCLFPKNGVQDHTVNRLLLMSSSEHHLQAVPMAFYVRPELRSPER